MFEKKEINEKDLEKVSGGTDELEYQEGWDVFSIVKNKFYCKTCQRKVDVIEYKQAIGNGYCSICHNFITGFD